MYGTDDSKDPHRFLCSISWIWQNTAWVHYDPWWGIWTTNVSVWKIPTIKIRPKPLNVYRWFYSISLSTNGLQISIFTTNWLFIVLLQYLFLLHIKKYWFENKKNLNEDLRLGMKHFYGCEKWTIEGICTKILLTLRHGAKEECLR